MSTPLSTIMVAILAYFIFGENLYVGRYVIDMVVLNVHSAPFLHDIHTKIAHTKFMND
jgi:hypothetical protein